VDNKDPFKIKALIFSFMGFFFVVVLLNFMNGDIKYQKKKSQSQVQFEPKKIKSKELQKIQKKKIEKKISQAVKSLKPKMDLAFATSGLDLGIDILGLSAKDSRLLSQAGETVMTEDVVDRMPLIQFREAIPYPEGAKEKNINGHVTVNILVNKKGEVDQVKLLDSQPEGLFDRVTLESVKNWSFTPAEYKGQMVSVWVKQKLKFQVN
jgi:periplasmic protein TonB